MEAVSIGCDERPRRGTFPIAEAICWNGLTPRQQDNIATAGLIREGDYGGGLCPNRAEVAVEIGDHPGPRFYCERCANL